jgi:stage II sporulation protein D
MTAEEIDFGDAFDSVYASDSGFFEVETITDTSPGERFFRVPSQKVRIALSRNVRRTVLYSVGKVAVHSRKGKHHAVFRGRCAITAHRKKRKIRIIAGRETIEALLPCTLQSLSEYNFIEFEEKTWRGAVLLVAGRKGSISVVNYLDVEDYLRGVVPLEIGKRPREEMEALKAQAVAARTYTYRRIVERRKEPYDMVATVADQVYGGAAVENRESDFAVKATKNVIMTYGDRIIYAYYHSTCGGVTADVHEAWGKPRQPYLRSVSDLDETGKAYCRASKYFTWEERWPWRRFSSIVVGSLKKMYPDKPVRGVVNSIAVRDRFPCGRVKLVMFTGSGWSHKCGGDETRYILRRGVKGKPILRSANFTVDASDKHTITLKGRGYGHGVGMCQMGAIGRAQAGQRYTTILRAYYPGIAIVSVTTLEVR